MPLAILVYECVKCGFVIDGDHNVAINLDVRASGPEPNACGERRRFEKKERDGSSQSKLQRGGE
jgi:transposase